MTGMFVKVIVVAKPPIPLVRIPSPAVGPGGVVWTVKDGRLRKKLISIATTTNDQVIAYQQPGGLSAGDAIVVSPIASPVDGLEVRELPRNVTSVAVKP
jgi:multidrug efflux pump subunit AcrA (membrane-fusion protein)